MLAEPLALFTFIFAFWDPLIRGIFLFHEIFFQFLQEPLPWSNSTIKWIRSISLNLISFFFILHMYGFIWILRNGVLYISEYCSFILPQLFLFLYFLPNFLINMCTEIKLFFCCVCFFSFRWIEKQISEKLFIDLYKKNKRLETTISGCEFFVELVKKFLLDIDISPAWRDFLMADISKDV